jgi:hypothetical protein
MESRRDLKGILYNFLGTFTSRYSDWDGYWLFGLLVDDFKQIQIDLVNNNAENNNTKQFRFVKALAVGKFKEQIEKAGLGMSCVREARLDIIKPEDSTFGLVNNSKCSGYDVKFSVRVISDLGKTYKNEIVIFVAPHNPNVERRSVRRNSGIVCWFKRIWD